ncbi:hypothetical protein PQG02_13800 [Nostoc sp. UHCC 0926]|uniref:hypothetical protein n=1 Tax=unclassified Nostoc TaxID=2593658 RepID=UPI0023615CEE|nr:hypothetical protein [Nostoc sp. UHCC 0926]WDD35318.1 hypothetical protein PQG02_13800 [Nostoc sp. UHCC 0926]
MALEHKNAAGIFPDRQHTESALDQLKAADFPMNKVSVVAQHVNSEDVTLKATEATVQSEAKFVRDRTIERIEHGALDAGSWGSIIGFLGGGLVTLAIPGISFDRLGWSKSCLGGTGDWSVLWSCSRRLTWSRDQHEHSR